MTHKKKFIKYEDIKFPYDKIKVVLMYYEEITPMYTINWINVIKLVKDFN